MDITVETAEGADAPDLLAAKLARLGTPSLVIVQANAACDIAKLANVLAGLGLPALVGATSCKGSMSHAGRAPDLAAFVISDPDGDYGASFAALEDAPARAAARATEAALVKADRPGEKPELVWISGSPGAEEALLAGIESIVGPDVPIIGGSAADNSVAGGWRVFNETQSAQDGVAVAVMFPSEPVSFAYQNGYAPTDHKGIVTKAEGRTLIEIDGRPAAEAYDHWTNGAIPLAPQAETRQPILAASTFWPFGQKIACQHGVAQFLLAHPATADRDGALHLFADVAEGTELTQMSGSPDTLVARAGRVAALARTAGGFQQDQIAGALMVYCGGCRLAVDDRVDEVVAGVVDQLGAAPFLGLFTFGEQGRVLGAGNRHGNLMISCIVFGAKRGERLSHGAG
ncbi:MAG: FIST N-terminal domain-containing protein [Pseudomonadota bacterium]